MNEAFKGFRGFIRGVLSESDGTPSASRVCMLGLVVVVSACIVKIIWSMTGMGEAVVSPWLGALPWIIGALAGLIGAPYAINQGGSVLTQLGQFFANRSQK